MVMVMVMVVVVVMIMIVVMVVIMIVVVMIVAVMVVVMAVRLVLAPPAFSSSSTDTFLVGGLGLLGDEVDHLVLEERRPQLDQRGRVLLVVLVDEPLLARIAARLLDQAPGAARPG